MVGFGVDPGCLAPGLPVVPFAQAFDIATEGTLTRMVVPEIFWRTTRALGWGMEAKFKDCQDTLSLLDVLRNIWKQRPRGPLYERPFFVGVTLRELIPESEHQAGLFGDPDNRAQLSSTMDKLNLKYGHTTLHFAGMLPARDSAPTRIAFTQIPVQYGVDYM